MPRAFGNEVPQPTIHPSTYKGFARNVASALGHSSREFLRWHEDRSLDRRLIAQHANLSLIHI
eukprot:10515593-Alexandrium_andersonii.AAC.1